MAEDHHISFTLGLDLQDMYDQARTLEATWRAAADNLEADAIVCAHPVNRRVPARDEIPALCLVCDRVVPAWALRRDSL